MMHNHHSDEGLQTVSVEDAALSGTATGDEGQGHDGSHGGGHDKHEGHDPAMFRVRLWVSLVLTVPILYFSEQIQLWFGYQAPTFAGDGWVSPILATVLFTYAGAVFLKGGYREIQARQPGMMTLISIAISVAYGYSLAVSLGLEGNPVYWELATLLDVMLLGHWIEMRSIDSASRALDHLTAMVPSTAHLAKADGSVLDVEVSSLQADDRILVKPGEQVPVDAEITEGSSSLNEAFLTGESRPVSRTVGEEIVAGSLNGEGVLTAVVTRIGSETTLYQRHALAPDRSVLSDRESLDQGLPAPVDHWHRRGRVALTVLLGASVGLLVDQATKAVAVGAITESGPIELAGKLRLTLVANTGVIGGFPMPLWVIVLGALVSLGVGLWSFARYRTAVLLAFAGIVGGGLGNLLDRIQHRPTFPDHAVVDWISIRGFATFNVADLLIVAGILVLFLLLRKDDRAPVPTAF